MQQTHTLNAFLYAFANGIERASYYGIRSILILYMIGETINMDRFEALEFYGWLTISFYFSKVIGAFLGDLLIGNKTSILIGGIVQTIGCILFCFPSMTFLYIGVGCLVIGNGMFSPNILAQFGKQYTNKPKLIDAGFSGLFLFINLGAFLGVMIIGLVSDINFIYGFILGGSLMLIATLIGYFNKGGMEVAEKPRSNNIDFIKILFVFIAIVLSCVFWMCYEMTAGITSLYVFESDMEYSNWTTISSGSGIAFALILAIIWTFIYTNQFFKFCIGLIIAALGISLLISFSQNPDEGSSAVLIMSALLLSLGETFLSPLLFAITTKYSNPKYLAIFLSLVGLPIMMCFKITGMISESVGESSESGIFIAVTSVLVFFAIIAGIMWFVQRQGDKKLLVQNEFTE